MTAKPLFENQACVVTGSSRGIGRETALMLAREGADVAVNYLDNRPAAEETAAEITAMGRRAEIIQADVTQPDEAQRLIQTAHSHFQRIDLLVNNVGPFAFQSLADTSIDDWQRMLDGNLNSAFYCSKPALEIMREQGHGHLIFIGSPKADSTRARQQTCAYGIAKTGVVLLAKTIAREEGSNGIRANTINPGIIETSELPADAARDACSQVPLNRLGTPVDIANAVRFLHSPQGAYCNGAVINVDGGLWI